MTRERLATAYDALAEAYAQVAHELRGIQQPGVHPTSPPVDDLPPLPAYTPRPEPDPSEDLRDVALKATGGELVTPDHALGRCPTHDTPWTVKDGGISRVGRPFEAFWKCAERDADGYCNEKPIPAWKNSHPIRVVAA